MSPLHVETITRPLSLRNDGELEIAFLGVGTAFSVEPGHTNFFIIRGEHHILVDFGTTGPAQLQEVAGISPLDVRAILPTHAHADHVGGIESLAIFNRYRGVLPGTHPRLKMIIHPAFRRNLWNMTLRGGLGFNEPGMCGEEELFFEYFDVIEPKPIESPDGRECWETECDGIAIRLIRTEHTQGGVGRDGAEFYTHAVLIDNTIFFSGDTTFDRELLEVHAADASLIIHDVGLVDTPLHPTLDQLRTLPEETRARTLLIHYPEALHDHDTTDFLGLAEKGTRVRVVN